MCCGVLQCNDDDDIRGLNLILFHFMFIFSFDCIKEAMTTEMICF